MNEHEDFQIELGQTVRRHAEQKTSPLRDRSLCAVPYDRPESQQTPIFIAEHVMRSIEALAAKDREREVGGVLLGGFFRANEGSYIEVTDFIEAKAAKGTDVSLTFTHETWEQISAEQSARGGDAAIVGWYHSHPGLGVFMSQDDEFIHSGFFRDPWQIAMVVDPIYHNWGCFKWQEGSLADAGGFYVFGERRATKRLREYAKSLSTSRQPAPRAASARADRRGRAPVASAALWAIVALLVVSQALTAFLLLSRRAGRSAQVDSLRSARELLSASDLSGGSYLLRQALLENPSNPEAAREMGRLADLAASAPQSSNEAFDKINFLLLAADKAAGTDPDYSTARTRDDLQAPPSESDGKLSAELAAADPVRDALRLYEKSKSTHAARLARAEAVAKALAGSSPGTGKTWYEAAVVRLRQEPLRRISYGRSLGEPSYQREYKALDANDRKTVDRLKDELSKSRGE